MGIWVVVPAYNEGKTVAGVIDDLHKHGYKSIIVVDDGSRDNTSGLAEAEGATVLRHITNRGQGAALKTGIDHALSQGAGIIVTFDADGQHMAEDISRLVEPVRLKKADAVLGSRFLLNQNNVPFIRRLFLKAGALLFRMLYGVKLTDSHNGLRALSRSAAERISIRSSGMEHASEIVEEIAKKQISYLEVPVTITYSDYTIRHGSIFHGFKILFKMLIKQFIR